jgi:phosphatidylglycerol:prolipoprotein diacylglycerol transferase
MGLNTASGYIEVHPVFLYESIATLLIFIILRILQKKRKFKGQILYLYFVLYGIARMFLEALRVDSLMLGNFRISQILSGVLFVVFLGFYVFNRKKSKNV